MQTSARSAWTVRELLVVFAVAAVLLPLGLLATLCAIERARFSRCQFNMRAIGIALQSYHDAHTVLPPAVVVRGSWQGKTRLANRTSRGESYLIPQVYANWTVLTLQHFGATEVADESRIDLPITDPLNRPVRMAVVPTMRCPSDSLCRSDNLYRLTLASGQVSRFARGNYAINGGVNGLLVQPGKPWNPAPNGRRRERIVDKLSTEVTEQVWGSGVAGINTSFPLKDLAKGQSNLVAIDEVRAGVVAEDSRGVWALGLVGASITWGHGLVGDAVGPNSAHPRSDDTIGCNQAHQFYGQQQLIRLGMPCCSYIQRQKQATARSAHGGVNVLLLDGTTRFATDDVDQNIWHAMHSTESHQVQVQSAQLASLQNKSSSDGRLTGAVDDAHRSDLWNSIGMQLKRIPAGRFSMGLADVGQDHSEPATGAPADAPAHEVHITRSFYMGVFEVTQSQYARVMGTNPSWHVPREPEPSDAGQTEPKQLPVQRVSWFDATMFCDRLSQIPDEKRLGRRYRLPTEAEWEYACRAGTAEPFNFQLALQTASETGFNARIESGPGFGLREVGSGEPNAFGLHDMRSNVFEWCSDWFAWDYYRDSPRRDPQGPANGVLKVVRFADWRFTGMDCKFTRFDTEPSRTSRYIGFRVVCDLSTD